MKSCLEQQTHSDASQSQVPSTNDGNMKVMKRLREATRDAHEALEDAVFNRRLSAGAISPSEYAGLMRIHEAIHSAIEPTLANHSSKLVGQVWREDQRKVDLVARDIEDACDDLSVWRRVAGPAEQFAERIREIGPQDPAWLLGVFYVVEGSTLGGMFLRPRIAEAIGCAPEELRYYGAYGRATKKRWREFSERMDSAFDRTEDVWRCVEGGRDAFVAYRTIFEAISSEASVEAAV